MTNHLQRRALEIAFDRGGDRKTIAAAFALAKTQDIALVVLMWAGQLSLRVTPTLTPITDLDVLAEMVCVEHQAVAAIEGERLLTA